MVESKEIDGSGKNVIQQEKTDRRDRRNGDNRVAESYALCQACGQFKVRASDSRSRQASANSLREVVRGRFRPTGYSQSCI